MSADKQAQPAEGHMQQTQPADKQPNEISHNIMDKKHNREYFQDLLKKNNIGGYVQYSLYLECGEDSEHMRFNKDRAHMWINKMYNNVSYAIYLDICYIIKINSILVGLTAENCYNVSLLDGDRTYTKLITSPSIPSPSITKVIITEKELIDIINEFIKLFKEYIDKLSSL